MESTEEAVASLIIPTESVIAMVHGPHQNPYRTVTVRRKAAKRSEKWYQKPAKKKQPVEEPLLPLRRSPRGVTTTSITGASAPPPNATVVVASTLRRSLRKTQLPRTETSKAQLDGNDDDSDPPPSTTVNTSTEWNSRGAAWEDSLSELVDYRKINGHCNIPRNDSKNSNLGEWIKTQRTKYNLHAKGKPLSMTLSRIQALKSLGFEWARLGTTWEDSLSKLADYRKVHGHCNVPARYSEKPSWLIGSYAKGRITGCT
jgi:hypothetical protein